MNINLICIPIYLIIAFLLAMIAWSVRQHDLEIKKQDE